MTSLEQVDVGGVTVDLHLTERFKVTRYSRFLAEWIPSDLHKQSICDFGCGTGVQSIVAGLRGAVSVTALDISEEALGLAQRNLELNLSSARLEVVVADPRKYEIIGAPFDLVFCNPSSLPTEKGFSRVQRFFSGGDDGLVMIKEFLNFANAYLTEDGSAIFLLTSLCDVHEAFHLMQSSFAKIKVLAIRQFDFREHYLEHRDYWQGQRERNKSLFFRDGDKECEIVMAISLSSPLKGKGL